MHLKQLQQLGETITPDDLEMARTLVMKMYKDENGDPFILTDMQCAIFLLIYQRRVPRVHLMTYTQYGKTHTVALAVLTRAAVFPEKWCIVAGREKQAKICMGYVIQHAFDNDYTRSRLIVPKAEEDKLKREKSKNRLTFKQEDGRMGEIFVLSADSQNKQSSGEAVMGFGAPNVILDEAALIDDDIEAKIFRMLGGKKDNFYLKIGNPFRRNHFHKDYVDPKFFRIDVDWVQGVKEDRINHDFIKEAMKKPLFDVLYENKFPPADMMSDDGYVQLLGENDLSYCQPQPFTGAVRMGVDPAGGGTDEAKWVVRDNFRAAVVATEKKSTPKTIAAKTITLMRELQIPWREVFVDAFGEGSKVIEALAHQQQPVNAINVGDKLAKADPEYDQFSNMRAYAFWQAREWIKKGGKLTENPNWLELTKHKYKALDSSGKLQIMPKTQMLKEGTPSPNTADALMLTFVNGQTIQAIQPSHHVELKLDPYA